MRESLQELSISGLRDAQRSGRLSAVEIADVQLAAVEASATGLNAVVVWDPDAVRQQARDIDAARQRGEPLGALAGIPLTVKDSFDVAGLDGSIGVPSSVHRASVDSPSVARLRAAGAVLLGKTNIPAHLDAPDSANEVYGRTLNPWDGARTAGGSSGGSAAAVSAGLSWGDLGSDLAGSIRVPASWCGVFGHRPSTGIISKRGHLPWPLGARIDPSASAAGPLAQTAADLRELFDVLAAPEHPESRVWRLDLPVSRFDVRAGAGAAGGAGLTGLRVGVWRGEPSAPVDDETAGVLDDLVRRLVAAGCTIVEVRRSPLATADAEALFGRLIEHEISFGASLADGRLDTPGSSTAGAPMSAVWADWDAQRRLRDQWESSLDDLGVDVVLAPVTPSVAPLVGQITDENLRRAVGRWSCMSNLSMGPSTTIPVALGSRTGMPVGVQAIGRFGDDLTTLAFAGLLEKRGLIERLRPPNHPPQLEGPA
ncbi:MAG: amidase [Subtercola sp.]|nr:amidase [Subtercola sp.]